MMQNTRSPRAAASAHSPNLGDSAYEQDEDDDEDSHRDKYLTFRLADENCCLPIEHVTEIVGIQHIAPVPDMPDYLKGVINLRGLIIPVIDVRMRFKLPFREYDERTCLIVVNIGGSPVGLVVDTVNEVVNMPAVSITPPPHVARGESARYVKGIGQLHDEVIIIIDGERLLNDEEQKLLGTLESESSAAASP